VYQVVYLFSQLTHSSKELHPSFVQRILARCASGLLRPFL
jgi:hypothetical protein